MPHKGNDVCAAGGAQLQVLYPSELPAPIIVKGLNGQELGNPLASPVKFYAYTPKDRLLVDSTGPGEVGGGATTRLVGHDSGLNKYEVTVLAPPGPTTFYLRASSSRGEGPQDALDFVRTISSYTGPTYGQFSLKYRGQPTVNRLNAAGRLLFMSTKPVKWKLVTSLQHRRGTRWETVAQQTSGGADFGGRVRFLVNEYGKSLRVVGRTWTTARTDCARGGVYRVLVSAIVRSPNGRTLWSKKLTNRLKPSACATTRVSPEGGRPRDGSPR